MDIKYYVDDSSPQVWKGGFNENNPGIDPAWTEVITLPVHGNQTTTDDGATWSTWPPV